MALDGAKPWLQVDAFEYGISMVNNKQIMERTLPFKS